MGHQSHCLHSGAIYQSPSHPTTCLGLRQQFSKTSSIKHQLGERQLPRDTNSETQEVGPSSLFPGTFPVTLACMKKVLELLLHGHSYITSRFTHRASIYFIFPKWIAGVG